MEKKGNQRKKFNNNSEGRKFEVIKTYQKNMS